MYVGLTAFILYGPLIPISLYISIEIVKVVQAHFIASDPALVDPTTGARALVRTSNVNEELGQARGAGPGPKP